ncbi:reverse transcriptase [Capsulimonas corticalis]|uniref:RNA-directed DNA polymerase n=1 Tax=Capsulimonas corticalis TaxID=2219043 RepID=A0A402CVA2_9BACT|nr:reverse transcriptase family protein [Capsulimonas corticalis]BDI30335.1 reverse transcriptase [Capsulimonas corticalis]
MNSEQRKQLAAIGKSAFVREEMVRLGFWPPSPEVAELAAGAEKELRVYYDEMIALRTELNGVEAKIAEAGNIPALLAEVRRKRIERVRAERIARRERRAQEKIESHAKDTEWRKRALPYLGHGVSDALVYKGGDPEKTATLGLPALTTASDVAAAIGISESDLAWLTYHRGAATIDHYSRFTIPKKRGGVRVISSPKRRLRTAQSWVLESVLSPVPVHDAAMAFRPARSVADNARRHQGQAVVIRIDLKDFFPSITLPRVRTLFRSLGYNGGVATLLALLTTEAPRVAATLDGARRFVAVGGRSLPQGACTSPAVTNLLCRKLDARLTGAAEAMGFVYTRYADDLVFSHAKPDAPVGMLLDLTRRIIADEGLTVNEEKTSVQRGQHRQTVTGLVVNGGAPRLSRENLRRFRAMLHQCERDGLPAVSERLGQNAQAYAAGYVAFIHMVDPEKARQIVAAHPWIARWKRAGGA